MTPPQDDRGRGILTTQQRKYLQGETDIESGSSAEREMRSRIRTRVTNAILDFYIINEHLQLKDLARSMGQGEITVTDYRKTTDEETGEERFIKTMNRDIEIDPGIFEELPELIVFLYRATQNVPGRGVKTMVESGVDEYYTRFKKESILEECELRIKAKLKENLVTVGKARMREGKPLTAPQIQALMESEEIPDTEVGDYIREHSQK